MGRVDVIAPGGDYVRATGTIQDGVLGAVPADSVTYQAHGGLNPTFPSITATSGGVSARRRRPGPDRR